MKCEYYASQGVTLVELVASIVIITVAVGGIIALIITTSSTSADPMVRAQSLAIAQSYMDEIMMQPYVTDGSTSGRGSYNEVDDYNSITVGSDVQDQFGNPITALTGYSIAVDVSGCSLALCGSELNTVNAKKITVTVTHKGLGTSVPLVAYRANY